MWSGNYRQFYCKRINYLDAFRNVIFSAKRRWRNEVRSLFGLGARKYDIILYQDFNVFIRKGARGQVPSPIQHCSQTFETVHLRINRNLPNRMSKPVLDLHR